MPEQSEKYFLKDTKTKARCIHRGLRLRQNDHGAGKTDPRSSGRFPGGIPAGPCPQPFGRGAPPGEAH